MLDAQELRERADSRLGTHVDGRYRLERLLGMGGMAAVYEAQGPHGERVAIKLLHAAPGEPTQRHKRLLREAYVANTIDHPNVVPVFGDGIDDDGSAYLVMELLAGETLASLQRRRGGKLDLELVYQVADVLLDVLAAAHARGVLHRDIKPDNLFLCDSGELKVLDFGVARLGDAVPGVTLETQAGTMLGTPAFMAQEQARARWNEVDVRTDLWAVGATLFTLISGEFVHTGGTTNERLGRAMTVSARSLASVAPELPAELVAVVDRALRFDRDQRYTSAETMRQALRTARRGEGLLGLRPGDTATITLPLQGSGELAALPGRGWRHRAGASLLAACAIALVFALASSSEQAGGEPGSETTAALVSPASPPADVQPPQASDQYEAAGSLQQPIEDIVRVEATSPDPQAAKRAHKPVANRSVAKSMTRPASIERVHEAAPSRSGDAKLRSDAPLLRRAGDSARDPLDVRD